MTNCDNIIIALKNDKGKGLDMIHIEEPLSETEINYLAENGVNIEQIDTIKPWAFTYKIISNGNTHD